MDDHATTNPAGPSTAAPETTEVTVSYDHPDNEAWNNPVTLTRDVPAGSLYRLIDLLDDLQADASRP